MAEEPRGALSEISNHRREQADLEGEDALGEPDEGDGAQSEEDRDEVRENLGQKDEDEAGDERLGESGDQGGRVVADPLSHEHGQPDDPEEGLVVAGQSHPEREGQHGPADAGHEGGHAAQEDLHLQDADPDGLGPLLARADRAQGEPGGRVAQVDRDHGHSQEDAQTEPGENAEARDDVRRGDVDPEVAILEELPAEDEVLEQKTECEGDQGHVEIPHPDHQEAQYQAEGEGHQTSHEHSQEHRPAVVDGQDGHGEAPHPGQGGLAEPDHPALAGNERVRQEDDGVADALGYQPQPEPVHDEGQQTHRREPDCRGPPTQGLPANDARHGALVGRVWSDGPVEGSADPG